MSKNIHTQDLPSEDELTTKDGTHSINISSASSPYAISEKTFVQKAHSSTSSVQYYQQRMSKRPEKQEFLSSTASEWFSDEDDIAKLSVKKSSRPVSAVESNHSTSAASLKVAESPKVQGKVLPKESQKLTPSKPPPSNPPIQQKKPPSSPTESTPESEWVQVPDMTADEKIASEIMKLNNKIARIDKFKQVIETAVVDLEKLRKLAWSGVPEEFRAITWQLLMGYLPANSERRVSALQKKRQEYKEYVKQSFGENKLDHGIWHQIHIDVPRTNPTIKLYQNLKIQSSLERLLYCWAIRHPASGYVQGINDLATPFFQVFLCHGLRKDEIEEGFEVDSISEKDLEDTEADTFWCLSKLLEGIQDNYTQGQPGIVRQIQKMKELIKRIDLELYEHITSQGIDFIQFAFRWMNCLLMRELSIKNVIRMWDTYLAEGIEGFSEFHVYVCAAFLAKWSSQLKKMGLEDILIFLQGMRGDWKEEQVEMLLSEAYMYKQLFHDSPRHLAVHNSSNGNNWTI